MKYQIVLLKMKNKKLAALIKLFLVIILSYLLSKLLPWLYVQFFGESNLETVMQVVVIICIGIPVYVLGHLKDDFIDD